MKVCCEGMIGILVDIKIYFMLSNVFILFHMFIILYNVLLMEIL